MPISQTSVTAAPSATLVVSRPSAGAWQVGQILQATVLGPGAQGGVQLELAGRVFTAQSAVNLPPGVRIALEVTRNDGPVVLKLLTAPAGDDPPATDRAQAEAQAWREALPRQQPLANLIGELTRQAQGARAGNPDGALPPAARQLLAAVPEAGQVMTPEGTQRALADSGLFLESKLARAVTAGDAPSIASDLKAVLLKAQAELPRPVAPADTAPAPPASSPVPTGEQPATRSAPQPLPLPAGEALPEAQARAGADLARSVDGALARIQVNQLTSLAGGQALPVFVFELPVRQGERTDVLQLRIAQEDGGADAAGAHPWSVSLNFDFEEFGPVTARLMLAAGQVSASFWAGRPATAELFERHLAQLQGRLEIAGVKVGRLAVLAGAAPAPDAAGAPGLLDVRA